VTFNKDGVQMCLNVFESFIQPANTHTHSSPHEPQQTQSDAVV